jgi:undecaprenyl-diphosphatase
MKLDYLIFEKINNFAGQNDWVDRIGIFGARYLIVIMAVSLLRYVFIYKTKAQRFFNLKVLLNAALAVLLGLFINLIISIFIQRPRPFELGLGVNLYGMLAGGDSFPSKHTTIAFALAMAVFLYHRRFGAVLLVLAVLVGLSRIFVGVHYPLDVLAGALVGITAAYGTKKFLDIFVKPK